MTQELEKAPNIHAFVEYLSKYTTDKIEICSKCNNLTINYQKNGNDIVCCVCNLIENQEEPKNLTISQLRYIQIMVCKDFIQNKIRLLNESIYQCKNCKKIQNNNILLKEEIKNDLQEMENVKKTNQKNDRLILEKDEEINTYLKNLDDSKKKIDEIDILNKRFQEDILSLKNHINELQKEFTKEQSKLNNEIKTLNSKITKLENEIDEKDEKINKLTLNDKTAISKISDMLSVSKKIRIDMLQKQLGMNYDDFINRLFDWAKKFDFMIDGDYITLEKANIDDFIKYLDNEFQSWNKENKKK